MDGPEFIGPEEDGGGGGEQISEEAAARFAGIAQAIQTIQKEEKRSKKRDYGVAQVIKSFLQDPGRAHMAVLIARLVSRNCPSNFILAIISLISRESLTIVQELIKDILHTTSPETVDQELIRLPEQELEGKSQRAVLEWITQMQLVLSIETEPIMQALFLDEKNMDGTILQLTAFVVKEFFASGGKEIAFEKIQPFAANILQSMFKQYVGVLEKKALTEGEEDEEESQLDAAA